MSVSLCLVGTIDSVGSSSSSSTSSSGVHTQLRQAVQLALEQQQQLEKLRDVVERQNRYVSRLCQRDVTLGLELRQTTGSSSATDRRTRSDSSLTTSAQLIATGKAQIPLRRLSPKLPRGESRGHKS